MCRGVASGSVQVGALTLIVLAEMFHQCFNIIHRLLASGPASVPGTDTVDREPTTPTSKFYLLFFFIDAVF